MKPSSLRSGDYHTFYQPYIDILGDEELMNMLKDQEKNFPEFIKSIPKRQLHRRYAEGKWTVMEVLVHILDAERVFQYRALRFARKDETPLPGFDQDGFVPNSMADSRTVRDIIQEYRAIRKSTILLFSTFTEEMLLRTGTASGVQMSVGALGFICCGHQKHHRNILRERYLNGNSV
jgi:uncharacterized damage-inducible protein DinB